MKLKKAYLIFCASFLINHCIISQQKKDSIDYYINLVDKPRNITDLTESYKFFKTDYEGNLKNNTVRSIYDLRYISSIQYKLGSYSDSENSAIEGITLLDSQSSTKYNITLRISLLNQLGIEIMMVQLNIIIKQKN
jgi:hypothetical protein